MSEAAPFALDVRTIVVLLAVASVTMTLVMIGGGHRSKVDGFWTWVRGLAVVSVGWVLIAMRDVAPPIVSIVLADTLLFAAPCIHLVALREFGGQQAPHWPIFAATSAFFVATYALLDAYGWMTLVHGLLFGGVMAAAGWTALRLGVEQGGRARLTIAGLYAAAAVLVLLRGVEILVHPSEAGLFAPNPLQSLMLVGLFAITVGGSFAFLLMGRERAEEALRRMATRDALTGLPNRRDLLERGAQALELAKRHRRGLAVLMLDLDHFKAVNDRHGHAAGDDVLRFVAATLALQLRSADVCGRLGGEEFAVVLPETAPAEAAVTAERIRRAVAQAIIPTEHAAAPLRITLSIGVASYPADGGTFQALLECADERLYAAKHAGRNRVHTGSGLELQRSNAVGSGPGLGLQPSGDA